MTALPPADQPAPHPPRKLTSEQTARAIEFARTGAMNDDIAALIGVHRATLYRWLREGREESERRWLGHDPDPDARLQCDLYDGMRQAQAGIVAVAAGSWVAAARTDWRAAEALLKTKFLHWRPADREGTGLGAGNADDAADIAQTRLTEGQANALVGVMRTYGDLILAVAEESGVDEARSQMGALARQALTEG